MGKAFSNCIEHWTKEQTVITYAGYGYKGEESMYEQKCVEVLFEEYAKKYPKHEREIEIPQVDMGGVSFKGFIDGKENEFTLIEDKFKSQWTDTNIEALKLDDQVTGYIAMWHHMTGVPVEDIKMKYRVTRRPALRLRKSETYHDLGIRMAEDVAARPEWYLNEVSAPYTSRTEREVKEWFLDTEQIAKDMVGAQSAGVWPRNTNACQQYGSLCPMWSICTAESDEEAALLIEAKLEDKENK